MSLTTCLAGLQADGTLDAERASRFAAMYEAIEADYARSMGRPAASARATADTVAAIEAEFGEKARQELLQVAAQKAILGNITRHMRGGGRAGAAALAHFDLEQRTAGISNIDARRRAILGQAHAKIGAVLAAFDRDPLGRIRNPAQMDNFVREAFGEATGDLAAREMVKGWHEGAEMVRRRFNAAGGHIGKLDDWGLPQGHDSLKVRQVTVDEWRDFTTPLLDAARMKDGTSGRVLGTAELHDVLGDTYAGIRSDGWIDRTPGGQGKPKLANQRAEARFLIFRDAASWRAYQERFGIASPFDAMMGHFDGLARDTAAMEILGPNPGATVKWLTDLLEQDAAVSGATGRAFDRLVDQAGSASHQIKAMHGIFTGETNRPVNGTLARGFATFRSVQTAAKLGGATLSAVTDLGFQKIAADFNGLEYAGIVGNYARLLNPLDASDREFAIASGLIADEAAARMGSLFRYDDMVNSSEVARRLANGVIRLSGLSAWTQAGKWAFGMEFMHALGRAAGTAFADLDRGLAGALERYGFDAAAWDAVRTTPLYEHRGARFLRPDDAADPVLATRLLEMIQSETRFAVPEQSLRGRALTTGNLRAGTVTGELMRSVMQFKGFAVSVLLSHGVRAVVQKGAMAKAKYVANIAIMTTAFGALALQMKQVAAGKDPRDMTPPEFWGAAFAQGGGAGLFGDFLYADTSRFGGNFTQTLAGPLIGTTGAALDLTVGNLKQLAAGEDTDFNSEVHKFMQANTPGQSLWYARLALQRLFYDQVQIEADPDYEGAFARMEARAEADMQQHYWWRPGANAPERAPDFSAIDGGSE